MGKHVVVNTYCHVMWKLIAKEHIERNTHGITVERECRPLAKAEIEVNNTGNRMVGEIVPKQLERFGELFVLLAGIGIMLVDSVLELLEIFERQERFKPLANTCCGVGIVAIYIIGHEGIEEVIEEVGVLCFERCKALLHIAGIDAKKVLIEAMGSEGKLDTAGVRNTIATTSTTIKCKNQHRKYCNNTTSDTTAIAHVFGKLGAKVRKYGMGRTVDGGEYTIRVQLCLLPG